MHCLLDTKWEDTPANILHKANLQKALEKKIKNKPYTLKEAKAFSESYTGTIKNVENMITLTKNHKTAYRPPNSKHVRNKVNQ